MNIEEESIYKAVNLAGKYLGHVHIGENNRTPPGSGRGHIPWNELASSLRAIAYQGAIVMEPFLMPGGEVGRDIKVFRDLSAGFSLDDEARGLHVSSYVRLLRPTPLVLLANRVRCKYSVHLDCIENYRINPKVIPKEFDG